MQRRVLLILQPIGSTVIANTVPMTRVFICPKCGTACLVDADKRNDLATIGLMDKDAIRCFNCMANEIKALANDLALGKNPNARRVSLTININKIPPLPSMDPPKKEIVLTEEEKKKLPNIFDGL